MTAIEFVKKLNKLDFDTGSIVTLFHSLILDFDDTYEIDTEIEKFIGLIHDEKFTSFGSKLGKCLSECNDELKKATSISNDQYENKLKNLNIFLSSLTSTYSSIAEDRYKKPDNISSTIDQHTDSLFEIKGKISKLNEEVNDANARIDDKIFTLLINTVAILGIFVAIAFTGFGVMSIFSNINLEVALTSKEAFLKNVFFLMLVVCSSYNLLLLLIYFIFKLSRPLFVKSDDKGKNVQNTDENFKKVANVRVFLGVDAIIFLLTVFLFLACIGFIKL